jgi:hypothetical protein
MCIIEQKGVSKQTVGTSYESEVRGGEGENTTALLEMWPRESARRTVLLVRLCFDKG